MPFSFRLRFRLPMHLSIAFDQPRWDITPTGAIPEVSIRSVRAEVPIKESKDLVARGEGYDSQEAAATAGEGIRNALTLAFAFNRIGADFGDRATQGMFFPAGLQMLEQQAGRRVLNDVHGLMTFESDPPPLFSMPCATMTVGRNHAKIAEALHNAIAHAESVTDTLRLAFDLFSASFFQPSPDSRFLMLMMAVETLIEPAPRPPGAVEHVNKLIADTSNSLSLPEAEKRSILGALNFLRNESIGQAGRRLVATLGNVDYQGQSAVHLFTVSYEMRSRLVHGLDPRPTRDEVGNTAAVLECMVADLLSGPLLHELAH